MQAAFNQFKDNIDSVNKLGVLYHHLVKEIGITDDLSDIVRSQLVYAVSALDKLNHELVKIGMLHSFLGQRPKTAKFNGFTISLERYTQIQKSSDIQNQIQKAKQLSEIPIELLAEFPPEYFFEQEIILKHKELSFQAPEKIADALSFIWEEKQKWQKIAVLLNTSDKDVKEKLKSIVSRRNQIVHEADIDIQTNLRNSIDEEDVKESVDFLFQLGESIFKCVV